VKELEMPTNLALNDKLINEAMKLSGASSKKDAVNLALEEFIRMKKRQSLSTLAGKMVFDKSYDYKKSRSR
jgi:Arc/MetJ family transcription regulator